MNQKVEKEIGRVNGSCKLELSTGFTEGLQFLLEPLSRHRRCLIRAEILHSHRQAFVKRGIICPSNLHCSHCFKWEQHPRHFHCKNIITTYLTSSVGPCYPVNNNLNPFNDANQMWVWLVDRGSSKSEQEHKIYRPNIQGQISTAVLCLLKLIYESRKNDEDSNSQTQRLKVDG